MVQLVETHPRTILIHLRRPLALPDNWVEIPNALAWRPSHWRWWGLTLTVRSESKAVRNYLTASVSAEYSRRFGLMTTRLVALVST
jgi:hypothetical protein